MPNGNALAILGCTAPKGCVLIFAKSFSLPILLLLTYPMLISGTDFMMLLNSHLILLLLLEFLLWFLITQVILLAPEYLPTNANIFHGIWSCILSLCLLFNHVDGLPCLMFLRILSFFVDIDLRDLAAYLTEIT